MLPLGLLKQLNHTMPQRHCRIRTIVVCRCAQLRGCVVAADAHQSAGTGPHAGGVQGRCWRCCRRSSVTAAQFCHRGTRDGMEARMAWKFELLRNISLCWKSASANAVRFVCGTSASRPEIHPQLRVNAWEWRAARSNIVIYRSIIWPQGLTKLAESLPMSHIVSAGPRRRRRSRPESVISAQLLRLAVTSAPGLPAPHFRRCDKLLTCSAASAAKQGHGDMVT